MNVMSVWGQTVVTAGGGASITCPATPTATWTTPPTGVTFSNWARGSGVTCASAPDGISGSAFNTANAAASFTANKFFTLTITAASTHFFTLSSITWITAVSSGACNFSVQYSNNGGPVTTFGSAGQTSTSSNTFAGSVTVAAGKSIVLYLIPAGTGASGTTVRFKNGSTITVTASACENPTSFSVTGGGASCTGETLPIGLSGSVSGTNYQLVRNPSTNVGSPVSGTGNAIAFTPQNITGTYSVIATRTDSGCSSTMTGTVNVSATDNIPPVILNCVTTIVYATLNTLCKITIPNFTTTILATDNCSGTLTKTQSPAAGTQYATTHNQNFPVVISVTDAAGNISTCTRTVRAKDATKPPIYTCPASQPVALDASCQLLVPDKTGQLVSTDGCSNPVGKTQNPAAGTLLASAPGMTHILVFTAADGAGNTRTCTAILTATEGACIPPLLAHNDGTTEGEMAPVFKEKAIGNNPDSVEKPLPDAYLQTMPNPFSDELTIAFDLSESGKTKLVLMDLTGQFQFLEKESWLEKGQQKVVWNTEDLPDGAYFVGLKTAEKGWGWRKVMLVR